MKTLIDNRGWLLIAALVLMVVFVGSTFFSGGVGGTPAPRDENSVPSVLGAACTTSSTRVVSVGHQEAKTVLSASSTRAWASIQVPANATNTVAIAFGGTAALGQGYQLVPTSNAGTFGTTTPSIQFGLRTDLPYAGAVTALTNNGTTTVLVTECNF